MRRYVVKRTEAPEEMRRSEEGSETGSSREPPAKGRWHRSPPRAAPDERTPRLSSIHNSPRPPSEASQILAIITMTIFSFTWKADKFFEGFS